MSSRAKRMVELAASSVRLARVDERRICSMHKDFARADASLESSLCERVLLRRVAIKTAASAELAWVEALVYLLAAWPPRRYVRPKARRTVARTVWEADSGVHFDDAVRAVQAAAARERRPQSLVFNDRVYDVDPPDVVDELLGAVGVPVLQPDVRLRGGGK